MFLQKVLSFVKNPYEINILDGIVRRLVDHYDFQVTSSHCHLMTPPSEIECNEIEERWKTLLNCRYNHESQELCQRLERNDDDNIAVRRRIFNRLLYARRGNLFNHFAETVKVYQKHAIRTLKLCVEALNNTQESVNRNLPVQPEVIRSQYTTLERNIIELVNTSFPEGEDALRKIDISPETDVPSLSQLYIMIETAQQDSLLANERAIQATIAAMKGAIRDYITQKLREIVYSIENTLNVTPFNFLNEQKKGELVAQAHKEFDDAVKYINHTVPRWSQQMLLE